MPEDFAAGGDEEGAVEGLVFEVVVGVVWTEDVAVWIGEEGEGEFAALFDVSFLGLVEVGDGVVADGEEIEAGVFELVTVFGEGFELLGAVEATVAEVEDEDEGFVLE